MGFFERVEPGEGEEMQTHRHRRQPWFGPPENELGVPVPLRLVLARTEAVAVAIIGAVAYSTGFTVRLVISTHPSLARKPGERPFFMRPVGGGEGQLRFGVAFPDGRKATNEGPRRPPGDEPPAITLTQQGGSGGGLTWDGSWWIYPIPPAGPLTFALEWPARDVPEQTHEIDGSPVAEAAQRAEQLWEDARPFGNVGGFTSSTMQAVRRSPPANEPPG